MRGRLSFRGSSPATCPGRLAGSLVKVRRPRGPRGLPVGLRCGVCTSQEASGLPDGWSALVVFKSSIWVFFFKQAIFFSDFIMSCLHLCSPFLLPYPPLLPLAHGLLLAPVWLPAPFPPAAAAAADGNAQEEGSSDHRHGDDQRLKVHPTNSPACRAQFTKGGRWQDVCNWVVQTSLVSVAPKTGDVLQALFTGFVCVLRTSRSERILRGGHRDEQQE